MKILIFTVFFSTSTYKYYISEKYILVETVYAKPFETDNIRYPGTFCTLLDMQTGLLHTINMEKTERTVSTFTDPGRWQVQGKTLVKHELTDTLELFGCACKKVKVWETADVPFLKGYFLPKSFTFCEVPEIHDYIKNKDYLSFLSFYNEYPDIAPGAFTIQYGIIEESMGGRDIRRVEFSRSIEAETFFTSWLDIPEKD